MFCPARGQADHRRHQQGGNLWLTCTWAGALPLIHCWAPVASHLSGPVLGSPWPRATALPWADNRARRGATCRVTGRFDGGSVRVVPAMQNSITLPLKNAADLKHALYP